MTAARPSALPLVALCAALAAFGALQAVAWLRAGVFEYPLDDVYIHLAMAEKITGGTYGVNAGEAASASSSILFPFLLTPFAGTELQRLLPLLWNVFAVAGCGWLWGRVVAEAALSGFGAVTVALAGPVLLNMPGVAYTGMEAAPHMLASLAIVLGLWRFLTGGGVAPWLIAAAIAAPLLRYEGLALALAAAGVLAIGGAWRAALAVAAGALGAVAGFGLFLVALGLEPLPGSVVAKVGGLDPQGGFALRFLAGVVANLLHPAGAILGVLVLAVPLSLAAFPALRRGPAVWLLLATALSGAAHLVLGQIGWMHRYEPYIIVCLVAAFLLVAPNLAGGLAPAARRLAMLAIAVTGTAYMPALWGSYVWNPRAIHLQQAQMARLAQDYLNVPVAVNDLGRVAWGNPDYVLDIWGLGSAESRAIRLGATPPDRGWAGPLAAAHGVRAAMIYDRWFATAVGADWVRIATLTMNRPYGQLGDWAVTLYATDPAFAPEMRARIEAFAATLPEDAVLTLEAGA